MKTAFYSLLESFQKYFFINSFAFLPSSVYITLMREIKYTGCPLKSDTTLLITERQS